MAKVDPKDFLLNTDYELDKIILVKTGDFVERIEIQHGLDFTPLIFGVWSETSDFTVTHTLGVTDTGNEYGYTPILGVRCLAFPDKIVLNATGNNSSSARLYYRVYAFAPEEANSNTPTTAKLGKEFMLNTDYNYRKLKAAGEFTQPNQSFEHNLGYLPQVMMWAKYKDMPDLPNYSNAIEPEVSASIYYDTLVHITPTSISINNYSFQLIDKLIWRIYYDEA